MQVCIYIYTYIHINIYTYIHVYISTYIYIYIYIYVIHHCDLPRGQRSRRDRREEAPRLVCLMSSLLCIYIYIKRERERDVYIYIYIYIYTHTHTCVYIYIYTHMYIYIYMYTHTYSDIVAMIAVTMSYCITYIICYRCRHKTESAGLHWVALRELGYSERAIEAMEASEGRGQIGPAMEQKGERWNAIGGTKQTTKSAGSNARAQ